MPHLGGYHTSRVLPVEGQHVDAPVHEVALGKPDELDLLNTNPTAYACDVWMHDAGVL